MARRDSEMVFRAKDEVSKAGKNIVKALDSIRKGMSSIESDAPKTDSALGQLGETLAKLQKSFKGLSLAGKLEQELHRTEKALENMRKESARTEKELADLSARQAVASTQTEKYSRVIGKLESRLLKLKAAQKEAATARTQANASLRKANTEMTRAENAQKKLAVALEKQRDRTAAASSAFDILAAKVQSTDSPTAALSASLDRAADRMGSAKTKLSKLESEFAKSEARIKGANAALSGSSVAAKKAAEGFDLAKAKVQSATETLAKVKAAGTASARTLSSLNDRSSKLGDSLRQQNASIDRASTELEQFEQAAIGAAGSLGNLGKEVGQVFAAEMKKSRKATLQARLEWKKAESDAASFAQKMRDTVSPTQELVAATEQSQRVARLAKQAYIGQRDGLVKLSRIAKSTGGDLNSLSKTQAKFSASQKKLSATTSAHNKELSDAKSELRKYGDAANTAESEIRSLSEALDADLNGELARTKRVTLESKKGWVDAQAEVKRLSTQLKAAKVPTLELAAATEKSKIEAAQAKAEYLAQRDGLTRMTRAARESATTVDQLASKQQNFTDIQARTGAAIAKVRVESQQAARTNTILAANARKLTREMRSQQRATDAAAGATEKLTAAQRRLKRSYQTLYGDSRKALSLTQRLRGEVLSLIAAYGGFYAVVRLIGNVQQAYQKLEAAGSRLNVVFDGNGSAISSELDFIRRTANRLGFEFGTLANEYTKLAVAAKGTALEGDGVRKIFVSMTEAARVNKLTTAQVGRVYVALTQMISKGTVSMEELRQQLGDSLPGAVQIFAEAYGYGTNEIGKFFKAVENGQISANGLVDVADVMDKRFGSSLPSSLDTSTTALGRMQNAAFNSLVTIGEKGLTSALTDLYNRISDLTQTSDFQEFLETVSDGLSFLVNTVAVLAENFDVLAAALLAVVGAKVGVALRLFASALLFTGSAAAKTTTRLAVVRRAIAITAATAGRAAAAMRLLRIAVAALMSTTGIGLLFAAIGFAIAEWGTNADTATEAMNEHKKIVDRIRDAYDAANGSVEEFNRLTKDITVTELQANITRIQASIQESAKKLLDVFNKSGSTFSGRFFGIDLNGVSNEYKSAVRVLINQLANGEISIRAFRDELDSTNEHFRDGSAANQRFATALIEVTQELVREQDALLEAKDALVAKTGAVSEQEEALRRLNGEEDKFAQLASRSAQSQNDFLAAMSGLQKLLPELTDGMSKFEVEASKIESALQSALTAARAMPDAIMRIAAEQQALGAANSALMSSAQKFVDSNFGNFTDGVAAAAALLRQFEGRNGQSVSQPYNDPRTDRNGNQIGGNVYRAGFGSDTITLSDQTVVKITAGMRVSVEDANRDLLRRITQEFQPMVKRAVGEDRYGSFTPQQQAALISIAYNYGELPDRIVAAVRSGTDQEIATAIRGLSGDNGGVNAPRRAQEAALFTSAAAQTTAIARQEAEAKRLADEAERRVEAQRKFHESQAESLATAQFELSVADKEVIARETATALREAELAAKKAGTVLTQAERDLIIQTTEEKFRQQALDDAKEASAKRTEEAERKVNDLLSIRGELVSQLQAAVQDGDTEGADALRDRLGEINEQLQTAIDSAIAMWEAVGGDSAAVAIERLKSASVEASHFSTEAKASYFSWKKVGDLMLNGLSNAFTTFSKAVAEGKSIGEAARDAFLQFAADFLIEIGKMIVKQMLFNALRGLSIGGNPLFPAAHRGGRVGSKSVGQSNRRIRASPDAFVSAPRYHGGGIAGLAPNELPTVLKVGEEVLTEDNPRHINNAGKGSAPAQTGVKIANILNGPDVLDVALSDDDGREVMFNFIRFNAPAIKGLLES